MFRGVAHFYKIVDGNEEEIEKVFTSENDFDTFVDKHPELRELRGFNADTSLCEISRFFNDPESIDKNSFERVKKEIRSAFGRSGNILRK